MSAASNGGSSIALPIAALVAMRQFHRDGVNRHDAQRKKRPSAAAGAVNTNSAEASRPDGMMTTSHMANDAAIVSHHKRESLDRLLSAEIRHMITTR